MEQSLKGKHIVLGITGGIAAYKSAFLLRLLIKAGAEVQVVITPNGKQFITPATLAALSGKPVVSEFFAANTGEWHSHVDLGLWSDLMVIAPATASTIGKMTSGVADNMLVTTYLSAKSHVMVAPAMDLDMWAHPSTQRNIETLKSDGVEIIEPVSGELASHLTGKGRMAEPEEILNRVVSYFAKRENLKGRRVLVTAGPTFEDIDPVRFIGNYSSGKMGFAIAEEAAERGADVTLISGPVALSVQSPHITRVDVRNARQMLAAAEEAFPECDMAILSAAVADYAPQTRADSKIKRENIDSMTLRLVKNPDIAATLGRQKDDRLLVGFALETDHERENAIRKMRAKNLDMIVLNSLRNPLAGFHKDTNQISILKSDGEETEYPAKSKREVAADILDAASEMLKGMARFCLLLILALVSFGAAAQELNCMVEVNSQKIEGGSKSVFQTLQEAITEYMNETKFSNATFSNLEKIDCRMFLTVSEYTDDRITGDLQVQLSRPVYNSTYTTTLLNFKDNRISFEYREGEPIIFNETTIEDNLTAILNYYAYLFLALDFDSFSPMGGQPYYDRAQSVVQAAQSLGEVGWKAFEDPKNRSGVLTSFTSPGTSSIRQMLYDYHRKGLDEMVTAPDKGRAVITESLGAIEKVYQADPMSAALSIFRDSKMDELVNIYSKAPQTERDAVFKLLQPIYPAENDRLQKIKRGDENN